MRPLADEVLYMILAYLAPDTQYSNHSGRACSAFIFENLKRRKLAIEHKSYLPSELKKGETLNNRKTILAKWWRQKEEKLTFFVSASVIAPNYLKVDELIKTVDSTLNDHKVQTGKTITGKDCIRIDLSAASTDHQIFIKGVFKRFFALKCEYHYNMHVPTTLSPNGILLLEEISLADLKQQIKVLEIEVKDNKVENNRKLPPTCAML